MIAPDAPARDAVLLIRVWVEPRREPGFRARLLMGDPASPTSVRTVSSPDQVVEAVRAWPTISDRCRDAPARGRAARHPDPAPARQPGGRAAGGRRADGIGKEVAEGGPELGDVLDPHRLRPSRVSPAWVPPLPAVERTVFISYSSKDFSLAKEFDELLRGSGIDTWFAPRDVQPGTAFPEGIVEGIQRSTALVVLVTAGSASSRHVALELNLAASLGKTILPLWIDHTALSGTMKYLLSLSQWLDVERPLADFSGKLTSEINRLLDGGRPVDRSATTRIGQASSVVQLHTQRDALVLGNCLATISLVHHAPERDTALGILPVLARRTELIADRLGTTFPATMFDAATIARFDQTADLVRAVEPSVSRVRAEVEIRHDRRAAHAFELSYRVTVGAMYVRDLPVATLDEDIRVWQELAADVELPRALLDDLADRLRHRRDPHSACMAFGAEAALFLEDRLLQEAEFAGHRASVWEMGCALTLAAVGRAAGASPDNVDGLVAKSELHGQALELRPPALPTRTGDSASDGAHTLHYMLHALADAFVDDIKTLYGQRASALLEAAVKSAALLMLYGEGGGSLNTTLGLAVERSLHKAAIPYELWSDLVAASREQGTHTVLKELIFRMRKDVSRYLSDLVVTSRVSSR